MTVPSPVPAGTEVRACARCGASYRWYAEAKVFSHLIGPRDGHPPVLFAQDAEFYLAAVVASSPATPPDCAYCGHAFADHWFETGAEPGHQRAVRLLQPGSELPVTTGVTPWWLPDPYDGPPVDKNGDEPELVDEEWDESEGG
jgi:hypothetical protein